MFYNSLDVSGSCLRGVSSYRQISLTGVPDRMLPAISGMNFIRQCKGLKNNSHESFPVFKPIIFLLFSLHTLPTGVVCSGYAGTISRKFRPLQ